MSTEFIKRNKNARRNLSERVAARSVGDAVYKQRERNKAKKADSGIVPLYDGETLAFYRSRPINAIDLNFSTLATWTVSGGAGDTLAVNYVVPGGRNLVVTGFRYIMIPTLSLGVNQLLLDLLVNNNPPSRDMYGMMQGQYMDSYEETFLLAGENDTVTMNFRATAALGAAAATRATQIWLKGNLLLDSGLPLNQEISNKKTSRPILKRV